MAPGDVATDKDGNIIANLIPVRYRQDFEKVPPHQVDYVQLSPVQVISVATSPGATLHSSSRSAER